MNTVKEELKNKYRYRIELHAHTAPVSRCSEIPPEKMAEIYHNKGYDAVVITNHLIYDCRCSREQVFERYINAYNETKAAGERYGLKVLLGAEIRFTENINDYLVYGVDEDILSVCYDYLPKGVETFRKKVKLPDIVFLQAHPFRDGMERVPTGLLDGIETFNLHPNHNSRIGLAVKYANREGCKITVAGSDLHHPDCEHEAVTALRTKTLPDNSFELAKLLQGGDYVFEIGETAIVLP